MYTSLRYPLEVRLGEEPLGDLTIALCGLRFGAEEPWLEGRPLPIDHVVEPGWTDATYRQELLRVAVTALEDERDEQDGSSRQDRPPRTKRLTR